MSIVTSVSVVIPFTEVVAVGTFTGTELDEPFPTAVKVPNKDVDTASGDVVVTTDEAITDAGPEALASALPPPPHAPSDTEHTRAIKI